MYILSVDMPLLTQCYEYHCHCSTDDTQPENLRAAFVSDTGIVLTWQLPEIASSEQNVVFSLSYSRRGSGVAMTITVTTRRATVGGLDSGGLYDFSVAAMYNLLNSTAASISQETQRELSVLGHA